MRLLSLSKEEIEGRIKRLTGRIIDSVTPE